MAITDIDPNNFDETFDAYYKSLPIGSIPGMTTPAINFRDAPVNFMMRQNNPAVFDPMVNVKNFAQGFPSNIKSGITKGLDFGKTVGSGILSAITGIPFAGQILSGITSQFENRPLGAGVIDEFGNVYDPEALNKMNALGGYYTDPARSARRRTARIAKMIERQKLGKKISLKNLAKLQAQEKAQREMQEKATKAMAAQNKAEGKGGYQSDFAQDSGFMGGSGTAAEMGSFKNGGLAGLL
tara:strand:- start:299 stop:1018 length:720 start_codon:yes stop_codon:yes gene_type:complete